jgi:ligand-binding SRPBCC domain-containing protein
MINQQIGAALRPYTRPDDVIVSTHELIWEFHQPTDKLISVSAEPVVIQRFNLSDPVDVWRRVQPTIIIEIPNRMFLTDGLLTYMQEKNFQVCEQLAPVEVEITIYRVNC